MWERLFNPNTFFFILSILFIDPLLILYRITPQHHDKSPVARVIPKKLEKHGDLRIDNYYWLKERDNPEVISFEYAFRLDLAGIRE